MRRLITAFRNLQRVHASILNKAKGMEDAEKKLLMKLVKATEEAMNEMATKIVDEARRRFSVFDAVVRALGIGGENHLLAREALAEIIPYVERSRSYGRLKTFFGLYKGMRGAVKIHSKPARHALARLTTAILKNAYHRARDEERILRMIWTTVKETRERLEAPA